MVAEILGVAFVPAGDGPVDSCNIQPANAGQQPGSQAPERHFALVEEKITNPTTDDGSDDAQNEAGHPAPTHPPGVTALTMAPMMRPKNDSSNETHNCLLERCD